MFILIFESVFFYILNEMIYFFVLLFFNLIVGFVYLLYEFMEIEKENEEIVDIIFNVFL